jgi:hypothetical protein
MRLVIVRVSVISEGQEVMMEFGDSCLLMGSPIYAVSLDERGRPKMNGFPMMLGKQFSLREVSDSLTEWIIHSVTPSPLKRSEIQAFHEEIESVLSYSYLDKELYYWVVPLDFEENHQLSDPLKILRSPAPRKVPR